MRARRGLTPSPIALRLGILVAALSIFGPASAEIYGWVDTDGSFTYSNLPPPKGARVTDVIPEAPPPSRNPGSESSRQTEIAALNERIRQIEFERDRAQRLLVDVPPPSQYVPAPAFSGNGYVCDATDVDCGGYNVPYVAYGAAPIYYYGGRYGYGARGYYHGATVRGRVGHGGGSRPAHASLTTPGHGGGGHR